jgi:putative FmdB family regulatory protein
MPIYEYVCLDCGERFELIRSMKEADSPTACESCESEHTSRLLALFNAHSGGRVVAGSRDAGCAGCSGGSCSCCGGN